MKQQKAIIGLSMLSFAVLFLLLPKNRYVFSAAARPTLTLHTDIQCLFAPPRNQQNSPTSPKKNNKTPPLKKKKKGPFTKNMGQTR